MKKNDNRESLLVATVSCVLAIVSVMAMRIVFKLDFQSWALVYVAAASTAAIRWTWAGSGISVGSALRGSACLMIGLLGIHWAGYPTPSSLHTASLVPQEVMDALGHFHVFYDN